MVKFLQFLKEALTPSDQEMVKKFPEIEINDIHFTFVPGIPGKQVKNSNCYVSDDGNVVLKLSNKTDKATIRQLGWGLAKKDKEEDAATRIKNYKDQPDTSGDQERRETRDREMEKSRKTQRKRGDAYETRVADDVNSWIKRDKETPQNNHIDDIVDNADDEFLAKKNTSGTLNSDIVVMHKKETGNEKRFFIEAKDGRAQSFKPTVNVVQTDDGFKFEFAGSQIPDGLTDQSDIFDYNQIMSKNDLGNILTEALNITENKFLITLTHIIDAYISIMNLSGSTVNESEIQRKYQFPRDNKYLPGIFDYMIQYIMEPKPIDDWNALDKIFSEYNISKKYLIDVYNEHRLTINRGKNELSQDFNIEQFKQISDENKITMIFAMFNQSLKITSTKLVKHREDDQMDESIIQESGDKDSIVDKVIYAIKSWYKDHKNAAYLSIAHNIDSRGVECIGGLYIFDRNYDPLNLQEKVKRIMFFDDAVNGITLSLNRRSINNSSVKQSAMEVGARIDMEYNGIQTDDVFNDNLVMKKGDDKNDRTKFFKENGI